MSERLLINLHNDTKIVATARFNNSKRLEKKSWWSLFSISAISITLILLTICENTYSVKNVSPFLFIDITISSWIFTTLSSIITLALSIAISSSRWDVQYEKMNDSAIKINNISRIIEARIDNNSYDYYLCSLNEYQKLITENPINHEEIDYFIAKDEVNKTKKPIYYYRKYLSQYYCLLPYLIITFISLSAFISIIKKVIIK